MRLYDSSVSGNAYKVRLMLAHLGLAYERVELSVVDRSNRPEVLGGKNPALRIPVLELDDGTTLAESNAILCYLADGTPYLPAGRLARARVLQWMFFEQYDHEPNIAVARFMLHYADSLDTDTVAAKQEGGRRALAAMERRFGDHDFLVGDGYSVADIALYGYTHVADEAGLDLDEFPGVAAWVGRVASQPGHVTIDS
jgi:glutathione S-transferase